MLEPSPGNRSYELSTVRSLSAATQATGGRGGFLVAQCMNSLRSQTWHPQQEISLVELTTFGVSPIMGGLHFLLLTFKRLAGPLASLLFTSRKGGNIKKPPLISHKMAANRNDAFMVLAA
jgi:hypothetical protein